MTFLWLFVVICSSWSIHRGAGILHRVLPHQGGCWLVQASQDSGMSWGILANFNAISLHSVHSMLLFTENWPKIPWSIGTIIRPCIHIYEYIHMHVPTKLFGIRFLSILKISVEYSPDFTGALACHQYHWFRLPEYVLFFTCVTAGLNFDVGVRWVAVL